MSEEQIKLLLTEYDYNKNEIKTTLQFLILMAEEIVKLDTGEEL